jgi:hypothetical protein
MIRVGSRVEFIDTPGNIRLFLPAGSVGTVLKVEMPSVGVQFMSMGFLGTPYCVVRFDIRPDDVELLASHEVRELTVLDELAREA